MSLFFVCLVLAVILFMLFELPGSVVWCLTLILENSQPSLLQTFPLFVPSFLLLLAFLLHVCYTFCNCPMFLDILFFFFSVFISLSFHFGICSYYILKLRDSFLSLFQSTGEPIGEGNGTPLQYPCLENPMDGGAW